MLNAQPKWGLGIKECDLAFSWAATTSGTPFAPDRCPKRIAGTTVTVSGTGINTVVVPGTFTAGLPYTVQVTPQCDSFANWFEVIVVGEVTQSGGNLTFVVQTHRNGVAQSVTAAAGARINVLITGSDSGGK